MDTIRAFLSKIRTLFLIFKKDGGGLLSPPNYAPASVAEYAAISLNMHKYLENA